MARREQPVKLPAQKARQGRVSGRVVWILAVSMVLALIAMVALLSYFYLTHSTPGV